MTGDFPKRGNVYWVPLDPTVGSETKKTRPCLIVSNNVGNQYGRTVIVAPISSKVKNIRMYEVKAVLDGKNGKVMLHQCRAVDKARLGKLICAFNGDVMEEVNEAIRIAFGLA